MDKCIFCKIINKDFNSYVVKENDFSLAIMDINPNSDGHILVMPKKHFKNAKESELNYYLETMKMVKEVIDLVSLKLNPEGFNVLINNGKLAGQEIDHLHIHVIPKYSASDGLINKSVSSEQNKLNVKNIYDKLILD